ncbi:MAG: sigma-70 family RNA polymerase sigma factor [Clostridiales bacterium]|nr:sigma-70 family RNA polymerase sigma factor [Clostridiales bacterium]
MALDKNDPSGVDARERLLIKRSRKGDAAAFEELALAYQQRIYNIALRMLQNAEDAADVTQEALLKMYRSLPGFRGESAFSTWVYRITVNACRDMLRSAYKQKEAPLDFLGEEGEKDTRLEVADYSVMPEEILSEKETNAYLQALIAGLTPKYRLVVTLREISGLGYQEISLAAGISIGTVKSRLNRARKCMQEKLLRDAEQYPHLRRLIGERGVEDGLR